MVAGLSSPSDGGLRTLSAFRLGGLNAMDFFLPDETKCSDFIRLSGLYPDPCLSVKCRAPPSVPAVVPGSRP
jgi:hypothetical protein